MLRSIRPALLVLTLIAVFGIASSASAKLDGQPKSTVGTNKIKVGAVKAKNVDQRQVQLRIRQHCKDGSAIRSVGADGTPRCVAVGGGGDGSGTPTGPAGGDLTGSYPNPELGAGVVGAGEIAAGAVGSGQIASGAVGTSKLADGSVDSSKLSTLAVLTANIADGAVNSSKVANNSLTGANIDESTLTGFWRTAGNSGTDPATDFLGTTDDQPLNFRVDGARALRLEPGISPNLIGGAAANSVTGGTDGATIAGGGSSGNPNTVSGSFGAIGGGQANIASGIVTTVSGGQFGIASGNLSTVAGGSFNAATAALASVGGGSSNIASDTGAVVDGGADNTASLDYAVVGGGADNTASGPYASIGGGADNTASGPYASIFGGTNNRASQAYTTAIGTEAVANDSGATVIASPGIPFESVVNNEFAVKATGGSRVVTAVDGGGAPTAGVELPAGASAWNALSDRHSKRAIEPVDGRDVLAKLAKLPIATWSWKTQPGVRHMGPMAQDFRAAFGLGNDPKMITTVDPDGVALAAIKGLHSKLKAERRKRIELERRLSALEREARG